MNATLVNANGIIEVACKIDVRGKVRYTVYLPGEFPPTLDIGGAHYHLVDPEMGIYFEVADIPDAYPDYEAHVDAGCIEFLDKLQAGEL